MELHRLLPGRCTVAVSYLYDNLLDLYHAYDGEDWGPLRRAVATEPSASGVRSGTEVDLRRLS
jgi:hypothetical protein